MSNEKVRTLEFHRNAPQTPITRRSRRQHAIIILGAREDTFFHSRVTLFRSTQRPRTSSSILVREQTGVGQWAFSSDAQIRKVSISLQRSQFRSSEKFSVRSYQQRSAPHCESTVQRASVGLIRLSRNQKVIEIAVSGASFGPFQAFCRDLWLRSGSFLGSPAEVSLRTKIAAQR